MLMIITRTPALSDCKCISVIQHHALINVFSIRENETIKRRRSKQVCFISKPWHSLLANIRFTVSVVRTGAPSSCNFSMSGLLIRVLLTLRGCQYFKLHCVEIQWNSEMLYTTSFSRLSQFSRTEQYRYSDVWPNVSVAIFRMTE